MVEPHLVDDDPPWLDPEPACERALEADRDVAQPQGAVALVEQRAGDDADRIREVDDPRVVRGALAHLLRDLQHDRHGAQRLAEAARARRLLADAAARERHRLVRQARGLPADADLDQDVVRPVDGAVEVVRDEQLAVVPLTREHAPRQPADHLAPLGIDVVEDEIADADPVALAGEPRDELRRVRRPAADHCDLHPLTPVSVTPSTKARCARKNRMITGSITSTVAAMVRFHCTWCSERNSESPIESVQLFGASPT